MENNNFIQKINDSFAVFTEWVLNHRLIVILGCLALCLGSIFMATTLQYNLEVMAFAPDGDKSTEYYMNFMEEYGNDEYIYILYKTKQGIFNLDTLKKTQDLVKDLKTIPYVKRVNSITNIEFMEGHESGELRVFDFMDEFPATQAEADRLKQKLLDKSIYIGSYISKDAEYAAIFCDIKNRPEDDSDYSRKIAASLKKILNKPEYKDFKFRSVGGPVLLSIMYDLYEENLFLLSFLMSFMLIGLLIYLFRQFKGIIGPFIVSSLAILFVAGFMGVNDFPITILFSSMPTVLLAIGFADSIHIISEYQIHLKAGYDNRTAIIKSARLLGFPCLFTSLTTAAGFGSLSISSMSAMRHFGIFSAFGVLAAFGITFTILLIILNVSGQLTEKKFKSLETQRNHSLMNKFLMNIASFNIKSYKKILLASIIVIIVAAYGISKMQVNSSFLMQFGERVPIYHDVQFVDKTMGGSANFEILLNSNKADGVKTLQFVHTLEKIQEYANSQGYVVKKSMSIIDIMKDVNLSLNNNDKSFYRVPPADNDELQNINEFIYELYGGEELERFISEDFSTSRLTIYVESADTIIYKRFHHDLIKYIESVLPTGYSYDITGMSYLILKVFDLLVGTLTKSLLLAMAIISLMMIFVFRSFKVGLISMVPNLFPIIIGLGFMGISGITLSNMTVMTGCIAIGLAVDDTIHFISRYRMEFNRLRNYNKALEASLTSVGRALTITTIILVAGFGMCTVSRMNSFFYFGLMCSICFFVALIADFFIAPALILLFKPFGKEAEVQEGIGDIDYDSSEEPIVVS